MFKQLQTIYPSIIKYKEPNTERFNDYKWFITKNKEVLGIHQDELMEKDLTLLSTFLKSYHPRLPEKTHEEERWHNLIEQKSTKAPSHPYRFVYFTIQKDQINPVTFKEAIATLFGKTIPILWENETTGIIIEEISFKEEQIDYEKIIDILMADISVRIKFYIGDMQNDIKNLPQYYITLLKGGTTIFQLTNKEVIHYVESIPYLLLHQMDQQTKEQLVASILKKFQHDDEMLQTIEMFLHHNLNVSETAKKMYMHRNSLQYRIDKFMNETGINIQKFDEAVSVKLALLAKKS